MTYTRHWTRQYYYSTYTRQYYYYWCRTVFCFLTFCIISKRLSSLYSNPIIHICSSENYLLSCSTCICGSGCCWSLDDVSPVDDDTSSHPFASTTSGGGGESLDPVDELWSISNLNAAAESLLSKLQTSSNYRIRLYSCTKSGLSWKQTSKPIVVFTACML